MPGLAGMIADIDRRSASKQKAPKYVYSLKQEDSYTYRDHLHTLAMIFKGSGIPIIARGKEGTPAEGKVWVKRLSASEGSSQVQPYTESDDEEY